MAEPEQTRRGARKPARSRDAEPAAREERHTYRMREVALTFHPEHGHTHVEIDGIRIPVETRESGVISHLWTFQEFGSPSELAEALVNDWGAWTPPADEPHGGGHGGSAHEHGAGG